MCTPFFLLKRRIGKAFLLNKLQKLEDALLRHKYWLLLYLFHTFALCILLPTPPTVASILGSLSIWGYRFLRLQNFVNVQQYMHLRWLTGQKMPNIHRVTMGIIEPWQLASGKAHTGQNKTLDSWASERCRLFSSIIESIAMSVFAVQSLWLPRSFLLKVFKDFGFHKNI